MFRSAECVEFKLSSLGAGEDEAGQVGLFSSRCMTKKGKTKTVVEDVFASVLSLSFHRKVEKVKRSTCCS